MSLSYYGAISLVLLTSFLWGFWHRFVKRIAPWPLPAFMIWAFSAGALLVWSCIFVFQDVLVSQGIAAALKEGRRFAWIALVCGMGFSTGMQINLYVVKHMGLIYSTSIVSTSAILLGTITSSVLGGIPEDTSFLKILAGALILLCATLTCQHAGREKDRFLQRPEEESRKNSKRYLLILLIYLLVFSQSYTIGMSLCVRTDLRPDGLPGPLAVGMLALGAWIATVVVGVAMLARERKLRAIFHPDKPIFVLYAAVGGCCCLGGDLLHNIASPVVSVALAWPLSNLSSIWQYIWGVLGGEFKGAGRKAHGLLAAGMLLYVLGVLWLTFARYGH